MFCDYCNKFDSSGEDTYIEYTNPAVSNTTYNFCSTDCCLKAIEWQEVHAGKKQLTREEIKRSIIDKLIILSIVLIVLLLFGLLGGVLYKIFTLSIKGFWIFLSALIILFLFIGSSLLVIKVKELDYEIEKHKNEFL